MTRKNYFNSGFKIEQKGNIELDEFNEEYCSQKYDKEYRKVCVLNVNDHGEGTIMLGFFAMLAYGWRKYYDAGQWRFENADCKNALLDFLISGKSLKDG